MIVEVEMDEGGFERDDMRLTKYIYMVNLMSSLSNKIYKIIYGNNFHQQYSNAKRKGGKEEKKKKKE